MSWEQYFGAKNLVKERSNRLLREVKDLARQRDNMVARVLSVHEHHRKNRPIRTARWSLAA